MNSTVAIVITSAIRIRRRLINTGNSGKNNLKCIRYMQELQIQMDAYGKVWDESGWKRFARRNLELINYLLPENKSGDRLKQKLHEVL